MKQLIIYGAVSRIPRRIIVPDDDSPVGKDHLQPGEMMLVVDHDESVVTLQRARELIAKRHGINHTAIPSGRCVVIDDNNTVIHVIHGDVLIDSHRAGRLVASETARLGEKL